MMLFENVNTKRITKREIGRYAGTEQDTLLIVLGGVHGNEPAGVKAIQQVLDSLQNLSLPFTGTIVGFVGNMKALNEGKRFITTDLNRLWSKDRANNPNSKPENVLNEEEKEQIQIIESIQSLNLSQYKKVFLLDLHTTSASGGVFCVANLSQNARNIAMATGVTTLIEAEKVFSSTTLNYANELGIDSITLEGGQHEEPEAVDNMVAFIFKVMSLLKLIEPDHIPDFEQKENLLKSYSKGLPKVMEFTYRHAINESDEFMMLPGFKNFDKVSEDQLLAHDKLGNLRAPEKGYLLMPLYQKLGEDGYFLIQEVK